MVLVELLPTKGREKIVLNPDTLNGSALLAQFQGCAIPGYATSAITIKYGIKMTHL